MHTTLVAVGDLIKKNEELSNELSNLKREYELKTQEELNALRKSMEKALIESDIKREVAIARLEAYEKMDSKTDREQISKMLETALDGLVTAASKPSLAGGGGQKSQGGNQQQKQD